MWGKAAISQELSCKPKKLFFLLEENLAPSRCPKNAFLTLSKSHLISHWKKNREREKEIYSSQEKEKSENLWVKKKTKEWWKLFRTHAQLNFLLLFEIKKIKNTKKSKEFHIENKKKSRKNLNREKCERKRIKSKKTIRQNRHKKIQKKLKLHALKNLSRF